MSYVDQELTVEEMLADPIVQALMRYDGVCASDVRHTIAQINQASAPSPAPAERVNANTAMPNRPRLAAKSPSDRHVRHQAA